MFMLDLLSSRLTRIFLCVPVSGSAVPGTVKIFFFVGGRFLVYRYLIGITLRLALFSFFGSLRLYFDDQRENLTWKPVPPPRPSGAEDYH